MRRFVKVVEWEKEPDYGSRAFALIAIGTMVLFFILQSERTFGDGLTIGVFLTVLFLLLYHTRGYGREEYFEEINDKTKRRSNKK